MEEKEQKKSKDYDQNQRSERSLKEVLKEELVDQVVFAKFATTTQHGAIQEKCKHI